MKIMLIGPVKYWWDHWETPEHYRYINYRNFVSEELVRAGHLVYRPHEAWKGQWHEDAQVVNDVAIRTVDALINLAPPDVYSFGSDDEIDYARRYNKTVIDAPCPPDGRSLVSAAIDLATSITTLTTEARHGDESLRELATQLLWIIDAGTPQNSLSREDVIERARTLLGVNTPPKVTT